MVSAAVKRRGRLMAKLNQIIEAEGNGAAIGQGQQPALHVRMAAVIREWFRGLGQKLAEKLKKELLDYVEVRGLGVAGQVHKDGARQCQGRSCTALPCGWRGWGHGRGLLSCVVLGQKEKHLAARAFARLRGEGGGGAG